MLRIRSNQLTAFDTIGKHAQVRRIMAHLRADHAELVLAFPDAVLAPMIGHGLARAEAHGLYWESHQLAFVTLMFVVAPNFDRQPGISRALSTGEQSAEDRFELLLENTTEADWQEAERGYDPSAWFPETAEESVDGPSEGTTP